MRSWKKMMLGCFTLGFAWMIFATPIVQAEEGNHPQSVAVSLIQEEKTVQPGHPFWVAVKLDIPKEHHAYWKNPGDTGMPVSVDWQLPEGWKVGTLLWPVPQEFVSDAATGYGYEGTATFLAKITPSMQAAIGATEEIGADISWLICSQANCLPGQEQAKLSLVIAKENPEKNGEQAGIFQQARVQIPKEGHPVAVEKQKGTLRLQMNDEEIAALAQKEVLFFPEKAGVLAPSKGEIGVEYDAVKGVTTVVFPDRLLGEGEKELHGLLAFKDPKQGDKAWEIHMPVEVVTDSVAAAPSLGGGDEYQGGFGLALLLAFAGGMLLNLMPCVLPVLSFKVMGFMSMAGHSRSLTLKHGLVFSLGVLMSFWVLAGVMLGLQAYGSSVGWGFQLQDPLFVAGLAGVLFVFSLSLFGVYELGTSVSSLAGTTEVSTSGSSAGGYVGSFLSGVLATAIATPCTGPFLGTAVGFAFTLAAPLAMLIFTSLGFGMAFPYLLLSAFPKLLRFMPKPGNWMVIFKEIMGFLLLATVLWLIWVFGTETSMIAVASLLFAFLCFAIGCWVYGKFTTPMSKKLSRMLAYVVTAFFFVFGGYIAYSSTTEQSGAPSELTHVAEDWVRFSPEKLQELRSQGKPVFIDFTAEWCLSCKANHLVLASTAVSEKFREANVVKMVADWTKRDPQVTEALRKFGRNSIPLYVLYSADPNEPPQILPQVLTPDIVMRSIDQISKEVAVAPLTK